MPSRRTSCSTSLPVRQGFLQLLAIDLDPLPFQRDQAAAGLEQLGNLVGAERFSLQADADGELQQRIDPDARRILRVDLHADAGPGRLLGVPPVGHPHDQSARFEQGDRLEELVRLPRRPREGVIDLPGIDESANQFRGFGGPRNREQEGEHRLAVLFPGILLKRPAQGFVLHLALRRQTVRG